LPGAQLLRTVQLRIAQSLHRARVAYAKDCGIALPYARDCARKRMAFARMLGTGIAYMLAGRKAGIEPLGEK
jgi:hypothetical protein